jgi:hypothetical protein
VADVDRTVSHHQITDIAEYENIISDVSIDVSDNESLEKLLEGASDKDKKY